MKGDIAYMTQDGRMTTIPQASPFLVAYIPPMVTKEEMAEHWRTVFGADMPDGWYEGWLKLRNDMEETISAANAVTGIMVGGNE